MSRLLLFAVLLVCFVYVLQASPVPQDAEQATPASDLDNLAHRAKKMFDDAKGALENTDINDALEKAKTFIGQTGENMRKELEKIAEKFRE